MRRLVERVAMPRCVARAVDGGPPCGGPCRRPGTRMAPVTRAVPKELLPLGVTPIIDVVLEELAAAGLTEVVVVGAPDKPALRHTWRVVPASRSSTSRSRSGSGTRCCAPRRSSGRRRSRSRCRTRS